VSGVDAGAVRVEPHRTRVGSPRKLGVSSDRVGCPDVRGAWSGRSDFTGDTLRVVVTRTDLHRLVDELPETSLDAAAVWLGRVRDPGVAKLQTAPLDDEPFTEDERKAVYAAMLRLDGGESVPLDALMAELDLAEE
jgi:hypothetical protein